MRGPSFLMLPETEWPQFQEGALGPHQECKDILKEMNVTKKFKQDGKEDENTRNFHVAAVIQENENKNPVFSYLLQRCSTLTKLRRVLALVRRFVQVVRRRGVPKGPLTVQERKDSESQLVKWSQRNLDLSLLSEELMAKPDEKGLMQAHGRLENIRSLPQDMRNPIILPRDQFAILLLRHLHQKRSHCGYKSLMHEARR